MALASSDDQERQSLVCNSMPSYNRSASSIRSRLLEDEVKASNVRVKIVGLAAYIAAGGNIRVDLFSDEREPLLTAPAC